MIKCIKYDAAVVHNVPVGLYATGSIVLNLEQNIWAMSPRGTDISILG